MDKKNKKEVKIKPKLPKSIDCSNCKFSCSQNIPEDVRQEICRGFWRLGDYRRQKDFILMNVKSNDVKRRRPTLKEPTEKSKSRTNSKSFFLLNKRVCQSFFLKTLAISNGPLIKAFEHKNVYTNFFDGDDKRGRHTPVNKLSHETIASVVYHLDQYTIPGSSSRCKKRVISNPDIRSLKHLYRLYQQNREESPSYTSFKRIFNENGFSFPPDHIKGRPQKLEETKQNMTEDEEFQYIIEEEQEEPEETEEKQDNEPKVIVTQVPNAVDSAKFIPFGNGQIFEIQLIEIPFSNQVTM